MLVSYNPDSDTYTIKLDGDEASGLLEDVLQQDANNKIYSTTAMLVRQLDYLHWAANNGCHLNEAGLDRHGDEFAAGD